MKNKSLIIILVIVAVVVIAFLTWPKGEVVEPVIEDGKDEVVENKIEQIDTSTWEAYRSEEFGFEIKYPESEGWKISFFNEKVKRYHSIEVDVPITKKIIIKKDYESESGKKKSSSLVFELTDWYDIAKSLNYETGELNDLETKSISIGNKAGLISVDNYEKYLNECDRNYILSLRPAPLNWGDYNTIIIGAENCEDHNIIKEILNSIKFF